MKKAEIVVGASYTDNKGSVRLVLAEGPDYRLYPNQDDHDCLRYQLLEKKRGPDKVGSIRNCTRTSFAAWAKAVVEKTS